MPTNCGTRVNVSLNNLTISNTANSAGISGSGVTGFAFTNGTVTNSGLISKALRDSNIAFNADGATVNNVDGAVSVTNSVLTNAYQHGVDVLNNAGPISSLNLSNNDITSSTSAASSAGSGLRVLLGGSTGTVGSVTGGSLNGNTIRNFPGGAGIALYGGNITSAAASAATIGSSGTHLTINGNSIAGQSTANRLGTNCVLIAMAGRGAGFIDLQNNGTVGSPLANMTGSCLSINATGAFQLTSTVSGNVVNGTGQLGSASGIAGGADKQILADTSTADSAVLNATVSGNNVSQTGSHGIFLLANATGTLRTAIENNTVGAPTGGGGAFGIRVVSGTGSSAAINTTVCARIQNNTAAGGLNSSSQAAEAIGLRKQGTVATTNAFGIVGLSPSPATSAQTSTYVTGLNPSSTAGFCGAKVLVQAGDNFTSCSLP